MEAFAHNARRFFMFNCFFVCFFATLRPTMAAKYIYVSTTGSDDNDGSKTSPLRTFAAAQMKARNIPSSTAVTVQFAVGTYKLNQTQILSWEDSGTADSPRKFVSAPGAEVVFTSDSALTNWRAVNKHDEAWTLLDERVRKNVMVAPLPQTVQKLPRMIFDNTAQVTSPKKRAVRALPNVNVVSSLVPVAKQGSETCSYLGQFSTQSECRAAALEEEGFWAYAWHDPSKISGDFAAGCYARRDFHGSKDFPSQEGIMSGVFASSMSWREMTEYEISTQVRTQHRCEGAECEYFDPEEDKSTMRVDIEHLNKRIGNNATSTLLRIYLVDFAMNVLPVKSITSFAKESIVRTSYPGTLLLGQKPGYCDKDFDEGKCSPAIWLLNTMDFSVPGQFAINSNERKVYYWPVLQSRDVSGVTVPMTTTLLSLQSHNASKPVHHIDLQGLHFAHANLATQRDVHQDAGGIQHNWARLQSRNALVTMSGVRNITVSDCTFENSAGGGVRMDGFAQSVTLRSNTFKNLGYEAMGIYGLGLGLDQVTSENTIESNDVSHTALIKFDSPAVVMWQTHYNSMISNYIHDTSSRALYVGGSRYCSKPKGFATDGAIEMNRWDQLTDDNIPAIWLKTCADPNYAYTFGDDCKCSFFRGAHGNSIQRNIFARVNEHRDRPFFSDGVVYVSGPGYSTDDRDVTAFEDNTYIASPGLGAPSFRMLYVDGYTGSMRISRNAVVNANAHQGFMLCNWYGHSSVTANVLDLGEASWGNAYEIAVNCDGNPVLTTAGNLVVSDESSPSHQPDAKLVDAYELVFQSVCLATNHSGAPSSSFLSRLNGIIEQVGGVRQTCK